MIRPLAIIGALAVLAGDARFQHATMRHRLYAIGLIIGAVLAISLAARIIGARRRPAPARSRASRRTPERGYWPQSTQTLPFPPGRSGHPRSRSGRR